MAINNLDTLKAWIKKCEGLELMPYLDIAGKVTIGYGRNISDNGISQSEADFLFSNDVNRCINELAQYSWYLMQPDPIKCALINMNFNLGISKFLEFKNMIKALENKDYANAALEIMNSKWTLQVGDRAKDVAMQIRQGSDTSS